MVSDIPTLSCSKLALPSVLDSFRDPDPAVRLGAVRAFLGSVRPPCSTWAHLAWATLQGETDEAVRTELLRLVGQPDGTGYSALEIHLDSRSALPRAGEIDLLRRSLSSPELFAKVFEGILDVQCRATAAALGDLAEADPDVIHSTLEQCLYSRDVTTQSVGLATLLEIPESLAFPLLASFPEELALDKAQALYREVLSTFDLRRFFRDHSLNYYPLRCLGEGGMGAVYLCRDLKRPPRLAALKFMRPPEHGAPDPDTVARFQREARLPLLLNHPGLVRVFDFGVESSVHWIDVEFIQGETLLNLLRREVRLPWEKARTIVGQLAETLDYLRRKRVIHRDIKPANLFLARDPSRAILGDFGLVFVDDATLQTCVPGYQATQGQMILGTPGYMSPEQATCGIVDHRSDLFSLGVIFYEMLQGKPPFPCETFSEYLMSVTKGGPPDSLRGAPPPGAEELIFKLLARRPEDRFQTGAELLEALARLSDHRRDTDAETTELLGGAPTGRPTSKERFESFPTHSKAQTFVASAITPGSSQEGATVIRRVPNGIGAQNRPLEENARGMALESTGLRWKEERLQPQNPAGEAVCATYDSPAVQKLRVLLADLKESPLPPVRSSERRKAPAEGPMFVDSPSHPEHPSEREVPPREHAVPGSGAAPRARGVEPSPSQAIPGPSFVPTPPSIGIEKVSYPWERPAPQTPDPVPLDGKQFDDPIVDWAECMPWIPWLWSWLVSICSIGFLGCAALSAMGKFSVPIVTDPTAAAMGAGLFLIGLGLRRARPWAYIAGLTTSLVCLCTALALTWISRTSLHGEMPDWWSQLLSYVALWADMPGPPAITLPPPIPLYVSCVIFWVVSLSLFSKESRVTFLSLWPVESVFLLTLALGLLLWPITCHGLVHLALWME